jgi:hypothetical protein
MFHTLRNAMISITLLYLELFIPHSVGSLSEMKRRNKGKTTVEKLRWSEKWTEVKEVRVK